MEKGISIEEKVISGWKVIKDQLTYLPGEVHPGTVSIVTLESFFFFQERLRGDFPSI